MDYKIRKIKESEYSVLGDFLYEAIFIPEGVKSPAREIIEQPELQVYISDFGKHKGDCCLVAELDKRIIGAVWVRITVILMTKLRRSRYPYIPSTGTTG